MTQAIERPAALESAAESSANVRRARLIAFALRALIGALLVAFVIEIAAIWVPAVSNGEAPPGMDYGFYVERTQSWLDGDGFYRDRQLHGPYDIENGDALYPPPIVLLMLPWVVGTPAVLWWAIPVGLAALALRRLRPPLWGWVVLAAVLLYKRTIIALILGNPAIWAFAGILAGSAWGAPGVLALVKPVLAPFALTGARHRSFWIALAVVAAVSLLFLPMWPVYLQVLRDAHNTRDASYVIGEVPTGIALAIVAIGARSGRRQFRNPLRPQGFPPPGAILRR